MIGLKHHVARARLYNRRSQLVRLKISKRVANYESVADQPGVHKKADEPKSITKVDTACPSINDRWGLRWKT